MHGTSGASGVGGGIASELLGGKFTDGFRNGVIAAGLNHIAHRFVGPPDKARQAARRKARLAKQAVKTSPAVKRFVEANGGSYKSISLTGVVGGGLSLEIGIVSDSTGASSWFFSLEGHVGLSGGIAYNSGNIFPTRGQQFSVDDFSGSEAGWEAGALIFGVESSGIFIETGPQNFSSYGINERGNLTGAGSVSYGADAGASIYRSKTWTFWKY